MRKTLLGVNIPLAVFSPIILVATSNALGAPIGAAYDQGQLDGAHGQNGLVYNGREVTNIFAYDASGELLTRVQLYDQKGRPLYTVPEPWDHTTDAPYLVPNANVHGRGGWNVYPLGYLTSDQLSQNGIPKHSATPTPSVLHDLLIPSPKNSTPSGTATPVPTATPTAVATPAP
jgi:hypothetical protein